MDFNTSSDGGGYGDIPTRPMRVKVLYSFDQDNKTNCLARLPNTMQIPAVAINDTAQVGVIDLQQCIQAIVSASPEVISRLSDSDFTVYAYDYSEEDTPLVGQGMLSAALATGNSAGAGSEKAMITGRVCKNIQALFSNGVKETLEVKLRLAPVSRPAGGEVAKASSPATTAGFDPNAWNTSFQQNRPQQQMNSYFDFDAARMENQSDMTLVDEMFGFGSGSSGDGSGQQIMGGVGMAETQTDPTYGFNPAFSHSAPGSRAGSPMISSELNIHNEQLRHQSFSSNAPNFADHSRPGSRASMRSEVQPSHHQRQASTQSLPPQQMQLQPEIYYNEDGQPRKRAKITQTDWHGRSSFGTKSGDLRVTASTAHSVHMHRPIAKRSGAPGADLEPPPRAPTPVPEMNPMLRQQRMSQPAGTRSFLRQASTMTANSDFMSDAEQFSDATMSSPKDESPNNSLTAEGTPQDIPSSPPVLMSFNHVQPSSSGLPMMQQARPIDSGYMSEPRFNSSNLTGGFDDDDENRSPDAEDLEIAAQYHARKSMAGPITKSEGAFSEMPPAYPSDALTSDMNVNLEMPGDMNQLPQKMLLNMPAGRYRQGSQGYVQSEQDAFAELPKQAKPSDGSKPGKVPQAVMATPADETRLGMAPGRRSSLALPTKSLPPASTDPSQSTNEAGPQRPAPKRTYTKRSRVDAAGSEAGSPAPSDTEGRPRGMKRSGSGAQRRVKIQQRLEASLANNEIPQHCIHCGAIETPTWRKLYVRYFDGQPSPLDAAEGEGETIGVEDLERDEETNEVTRYVIRKSMKKTKDFTPGEGFECVTVCNPCGLWFVKFRTMRPPEKWNRKSSSRRSKKKAATGGDGPGTDGVEPQSEAFFTDPIGPDDAADDDNGVESAQLDGPVAGPQTQRPSTGRPRANSLQPLPRRKSGDSMNASQLDAALTRAVQSSPVPFRGSQHSPIEIQDITPKPTRRLLFTSPRRSSEVKSLDDNGQASLNATPPSGKGSAGSTMKPSSLLKAGVRMGGEETMSVNVFDAFTFDKENVGPGMELDEDLMRLFEGSPSIAFKTPSKTASSKTGITPRSSQRQLDHVLKTPTPASQKRKPLSPNPNATNNATTAAITDSMTSPSSSRYFLRSTPSRQDRTPGRAHGNELTPFSCHLAQMLSDANDSAAAFTSPSRALDFSDLPVFGTQGRSLAMGEMDWSGMGDILSSEFAAFEEGGEGGQ